MPHPANKAPVATAPLSVAILVRNQAAILEPRVTAWLQYLRTLARPFEILLVDDASDDDTFAAAESVAVKNVELSPIRLEKPTGIGAALRAALQRSQHPLFFYTTLDYLYQPSELKKLLDRIDDVDIATGFRTGRAEPGWYKAFRTVRDAFLRVAFGIPRDPLPGWLGGSALRYARLVRFVFGVHIVDIDSGFKLFRREIFDRIPIQSDGPFVHAEIIAKANFMTLWMDEIPIAPAPEATAAVLATDLNWPGRLADMKRVLAHPSFGPWQRPAPIVAES
jgi:glycosyltransferase involved in cell wall biosynthesis